MGPAACTRHNLRLALATRAEVLKLAQVEALSGPAAATAATAAAGTQPPPASPSMLRGLIVRVKYGGVYCMLPAVRLAREAGGAQGLEVLSPDPRRATLVVPLDKLSATNPLSDEEWGAVGRAEAELLAALLRQRGQPLMLSEVAAAAWRKQATLQWHAKHGSKPVPEQQRRLRDLLQRLQDEQLIANMQRQLDAEAQPQPVPQQMQQQLLPVHNEQMQLEQQSRWRDRQTCWHDWQQQQHGQVRLPPPQLPLHEQQPALPAQLFQAMPGPLSYPASPAAPSPGVTTGLAPPSMVRLPQPARQVAAHDNEPELPPGFGPSPSAAPPSDIWPAHAAGSAAPLLPGSGMIGSGAGTAAAGIGQPHVGQAAQPWQAEPHNVLAYAPDMVPQPVPVPAQGVYGSWMQGHGQQLPGEAASAGQPAASPGLCAATVAPTGTRHDNSRTFGSDAILVQLPGDPPPSLPSARAILAATLRHAVPGFERNFEDKRAALSGLLQLGLGRSAGGGEGAFEQAPVRLVDLEAQLQITRVELLGRPASMEAALKLLRDVKEQRLLEFARQDGHQLVLLRVDRLADYFGRPEDVQAGRPEVLGSGGKRGGSAPRRSLDGRPTSAAPAAGRAEERLRHFAPVRLLSNEWALTGPQLVLPGIPHLPEHMVLRELEDLCREVAGTTVVSSRVFSKGDKRGDIVYLQLPSPEDAALTMERLQFTAYRGINLQLRPEESDLRHWEELHPEEASTARRILADLRSGALADWTRRRTGGSRVPATRGRGRGRSRDRSRSRSRSRGHRGLPPAGVLLAPAFVRSASRNGWELTCANILVSGLPPLDEPSVQSEHQRREAGSGSGWRGLRSGEQRRSATGREVRLSTAEVRQLRQLEEACEKAGATVICMRREKGQGLKEYGDMAYLTLASAAQAARVIEKLSGKLVLGRRVFVLPRAKDVAGIKKRYPELASEAKRALDAAINKQEGAAASHAAHAVPLGGEKRPIEVPRRRSPSPRGRKRCRSRSRTSGTVRSRRSSPGRHGDIERRRTGGPGVGQRGGWAQAYAVKPNVEGAKFAG